MRHPMPLREIDLVIEIVFQSFSAAIISNSQYLYPCDYGKNYLNLSSGMYLGLNVHKVVEY